MLHLNGNLTDLDGFDVPNDADRLATNIFFPYPSGLPKFGPTGGQIALDGKLVDVPAAGNWSIPAASANATIALAIGRTIGVARVLCHRCDESTDVLGAPIL